MEFIKINETEKENAKQTSVTCKSCNNKNDEKDSLDRILDIIDNVISDKNVIKTETLINLIAYFYELFDKKDTKDRFEPFIKDCKEQAIKQVTIKNMLVFKDKEIPDSDFDNGMNVIPNENTETDNQADNNVTQAPQDNQDNQDNQVENQETDNQQQNQGSDTITDTSLDLKQ